jgi:pSer/pThr/pTyr-binding forkhead associated (FHA) protein
MTSDSPLANGGSMKVRLIERGDSPEQTREILVGKDQFLIGRGPDCDLRLHGDTVSRHHCIIRQEADEAALVDLGSSNGTFVNGTRVRSQAALTSGDVLKVGDFSFVVLLGDQTWSDVGRGTSNAMSTTQRIPNPPKPQ